MSYEGPTPTKFGQYRIAEPLHWDRLHLHMEGTPLKEVGWTPPIGVLDQEDLFAQGIQVSQLVPGAQDVDALGSCTANASMAHLSERLVAAGKDISVAGLSTSDPVANEKRAIQFYHATTMRTGDPSQEFPPSDCGSTGLYCCQEAMAEGLISDYKTATGALGLISLLQAGSVIMGAPFFYSWMQPASNGFVDGDGSYDALEAAVASGVAGGHETCVYAVPRIAQSHGQVVLQESWVDIRNSWSPSWGLNGNWRLHLSTLQYLSQYIDYKQFVI